MEINVDGVDYTYDTYRPGGEFELRISGSNLVGYGCTIDVAEDDLVENIRAAVLRATI